MAREQKHDYSFDGRGGNPEAVEVIVRKGNRYGSSPEGTHVWVDPVELRNPSTRSACMTLDEAEEILRKQEAAANKPKPQSQITQMVESGLDRLRRHGEEAARAKAEVEAEVESRLAERAREESALVDQARVSAARAAARAAGAEAAPSPTPIEDQVKG